MQVGFGVWRVLDVTGYIFGYISLHILTFSPNICSMKGFPTFFPTLTKSPCAWVLEAIAGSPSINSLLLQHWHRDPGSDSGTAPAWQGTQGQFSEEHLCSPIPSLDSPRIHPHCRTAASSELRLTSLRQSTWNKIKWTNVGFNWDSQLQFQAGSNRYITQVLSEVT